MRTLVRRAVSLSVLFFLAGPPRAIPSESQEAPPGFRQPDPRGHPDLYVWTDTCNVHVLRDGDAALLVDLGNGSVLDRLGDIGVRRVEWVLFTHHHREQLQGFPRLKGGETKVAGPAAERDLFEKPANFRRMKVRLGDPFTIHGASYVRPPVRPVPLDRAFGKRDTFEWRGREFWCVDTPGNSPGGMSYLLRRGDRWLAFSGDVMLDGARMHTWYDTEWDYGFARGIHAICNSAGMLQGFEPEWLLPSHGPPVRDAAKMLAEYQLKIRRLERLYVRGYDVHTFSAAVQDKVSRPTSIPFLWKVLPRLYKFRGPNLSPNFSLILAGSGRALVVDCGLIDVRLLDRTLDLMRERMGLKGIDAVVVTHMHGDHFLQVPHLREKWGAKAWAIDRMGPVCEHPERFDYAAPVQAYGAGLDGLKFDRLFRSGERFEWEGHAFTVDWMPGQTEFALCLWGVIDGRKVAFTGDNIFGDPDDPAHTGHEAVVAHNSSVLEEGYILGAEYLARLQPDMIVGGHSYVMDRPAGLIERFRKWSTEMRDAFRALSPEEDYRYFYDPFWVRAEPYRVSVPAGGEIEVAVHVRNFRSHAQAHRIGVHAPPGLSAEPPELAGELAAESRGTFPLRLRAGPEAKEGVNLVAFDVSLDGRRYGERFDLVVEVRP